MHLYFLEPFFYVYCCPLSLAYLAYFFLVDLFQRVLLLIVDWLFVVFAYALLDRIRTFSSSLQDRSSIAVQSLMGHSVL